MRVAIIAPGSRGDIQPYLALGVGLARSGHDVRIVTTTDHTALVQAYGLTLHVVPLDVKAALQTDRVSASVEGGSVVASFRELTAIAERGSRLLAEVGLSASRGVDAILGETDATLAAPPLSAVGGGGSPEDFAAFIAQQQKIWKDIVQRAHIKPD